LIAFRSERLDSYLSQLYLSKQKKSESLHEAFRHFHFIQYHTVGNIHSKIEWVVNSHNTFKLMKMQEELSY